MCGRFALNAETDELIREFVAQGGRAEDWRPAYSIAPTQVAPIVRDRVEDGTIDREVALARWDWVKPRNMPQGRPLFNARIEKLSGSWAAPFSSSRCIVPMLGYYEWTTDGKLKTPHFLHSDGLLAAAGLTWHMDVNGEPVRCFVVITRESRDASGEIHDRMPAFLTPDLYDTWLNPTPLDKGDRVALLGELDHTSAAVAATIREHTVDRAINNSRTVDPTDPQLIEAV